MSSVGPESGTDPVRERLPEVRSELRRLGYLDHQVERFLLQDALKPERPMETVGHLAAKVGLLIGLPNALLVALVLAGANGHLQSSPFDLLPLFAHLVPPAVLGPGISFLCLAGLLTALLRWTHVRRIEAVSLGLAMVTATVTVLVALQQLGWSLFHFPRWQWISMICMLPFFAYLVFKVVHGGLLTLAIRLTDLAPEQPSSYGRWVVLGLVLVTFLLMVPAALDMESGAAPSPAGLPVTMGERVIVIGIDGVLPQELDYLMAAGELPTLAELAEQGLATTYSRPEESPIAFWTTVATGLPSSLHGLQSLDTFRPLGMSRPLRLNGWARYLWTLEAKLGLVEYRPVLANSRKAWSFWELAGRGGAQSLVVGWWGTFPVEPIPGTVVAHGGYGLLRDDSALAVHPPSLVQTFQGVIEGLELPDRLVAGMAGTAPAEIVEESLDEVVLADDFYLEVFRRRLSSSPRAAAVYLSGLDIAAAKMDLGAVAHGDLVRRQLQAVDALVGELTADSSPATLVLVVDPGRRGGRHGHVMIRRPEGCAGTDAVLSAEEIGAAVIRALGLPQSRELPQPPAGCAWRRPPMVVESFGPRVGPVSVDHAADSEEYLENLKSLGYL